MGAFGSPSAALRYYASEGFSFAEFECVLCGARYLAAFKPEDVNCAEAFQCNVCLLMTARLIKHLDFSEYGKP